MLTQSDLIILARAALAAALGFLIGWERQITGSAIKVVEYWVGRMVGYALPPASMDALVKDVSTSPGVMYGAITS